MSTAQTRAVAATVRMLEMRDDLRTLLGPERYRNVVDEYTRVLRAMMDGEKCGALEALRLALRLAKSDGVEDGGAATYGFVAAYVEMKGGTR